MSQTTPAVSPLTPTGTTVDNRWGRLHVLRVGDLPAKLEISAATRARQRGQLLAYAEGSSVNPWRHIRFYAGADKATPLWSLAARWPLLAANSYRITTPDGQLLAAASKEVGKTILSAVFHVATPDGLELVGKDRNIMQSKVRKVVDTGGPIAFSFMAGDDEAMSVQRGWGRHDPYLVSLPKLPGGRQLDWRVGATLACALDVLLNRM